ncbi:MAG: hypothetical protein MUO76_14910 [Anaerolineaceae bacterium]|nr:hypothetical protein [Anaerolineaceae bacterium]
MDDNEFFESLYATLTAWGMQRMGPGNTKLVEFEEMRQSFLEQRDRIESVQKKTLFDIAWEDVQITAEKCWEIICSLRVGIGRVKLVAGSKALQHLIPDLIPPIDRQYSLQFFYGNKNLNQRTEGGKFNEIFSCYHQVASELRVLIET